MDHSNRSPGGPRGAIGALAEEAAAGHLAAAGWRILARNVRVGRDEIDLLGLEPGPPPTLVIVEVRSRSGPRFGAPEESVDRAKVARLYEAAIRLVRHRRLPDGRRLPDVAWRVDLVTVRRSGSLASWRVSRHVRGLTPP